MRRITCVALSAVLMGSTLTVVNADVIVAPQCTESFYASGAIYIPFQNAPITYQEYISSSSFTSITQPVHITAVRMKLAIDDNCDRSPT